MSEARARWEMLNLIRREKFDIVLPKTMRENKIDMWIHVMREGNPDPLALDLGGDSGYFIFTDRGGDRIERAVLGGGGYTVRNSGAYDIFGSADDLAELAGPVEALRFVCYDVNDLESPTEVPASIRLVTWEAVFKSSAPLTQGRSIMGASFLRTDARAIPEATATTGRRANGLMVCSPTGGTGRHDGVKRGVRRPQRGTAYEG